MKFYLASSFGRKVELQGYAAELEGRGHVCTSRWLREPHQIDLSGGDELRPDGPAWMFASENIDDIQSADALVVFSSTGTRHPTGVGGHHTEFGYTLAIGKPIFFIGQRGNVFHSLVPATRMFVDWRGFILLIDYVVEQIRGYQASEKMN